MFCIFIFNNYKCKGIQTSACRNKLPFLFLIGIATRYLVESQIKITAYSFPCSDFGSGPIVSVESYLWPLSYSQWK